MVQFLESCSTQEICVEHKGNDEVLRELRCKLRDWLALQPHLPQDVPESRLEHFVISTKLCLEKAKQKLEMYYTIRHLVPELFDNRDPMSPSIVQLRQTFQWICLPKLTKEKYRVTICKAINTDPDKFHPWTFFKYTLMVNDIRISECRSFGDIYIYDLSGIQFRHITKLSPITLKKCEVAATQAYGIKIKGIHFINVPSFIDRVVFIVKSVLKSKLASRIHVHSMGVESIYEFIPKSVLPSDYGGDQPTMSKLSETWEQKLAEWRDWFLAQQNLNVNETLRPKLNRVNADELFGFTGSFRKLDVD